MLRSLLACLPRFECLQDIKGKIALIIGASTGLGRGVADRLAQAGMTVIGTSRNPQQYTNGNSCTYTKPGDRCKPGVYGFLCFMFTGSRARSKTGRVFEAE